MVLPMLAGYSLIAPHPKVDERATAAAASSLQRMSDAAWLNKLSRTEIAESHILLSASKKLLDGSRIITEARRRG